MEISRRELFAGAMAAAAVSLVGKATAATAGKDAALSVFISDVHVADPTIKTRWGIQPEYQNAYFERAVDDILALRPRPARVVVFGDVALWFGWRADYAKSRPAFERLKAAGIDVFVTTGNHDHRVPMFEAFPWQAKITPVPNRLVSVIDLGAADLFLMDSLKERIGDKGETEGVGNDVDGALDAAQQDWLTQAAKRAKRPFFVGAHHPPHEVCIGKEKVTAAFEDNPLFAGYIHGHNHRWIRSWHHKGYSNRHVTLSVGLPSTGWWGDIGYAVMRTYADRAELSLVQKEFFFPKPLGKDEVRPREWDTILAANRNSVVTFPY